MLPAAFWAFLFLKKSPCWEKLSLSNSFQFENKVYTQSVMNDSQVLPYQIFISLSIKLAESDSTLHLLNLGSYGGHLELGQLKKLKIYRQTSSD